MAAEGHPSKPTAKKRRSRERGRAYPLAPARAIYRWLIGVPVGRSQRALQMAVAQQLFDRGVPWPELGERWVRITFRLAGREPVTLRPTRASAEADLRVRIGACGEIVEWTVHEVEAGWSPPPGPPPPERHGDNFEAILRRVQRNWRYIAVCDI
jgi:hypothetical protein